MKNLISRQKILNSAKMAVAAIGAVLAALALKLDFSVSAGIVAILSIQPTKKETIRTGLSRFYAFVSALFISFFCYKIFGFSNTAFFVYMGFFIVICQIFGWYSAIAMDSVLISHFILFGKMGFYELRNEILLFAIGVGFGVLMNLFLKKNVPYIERLKKEADRQIKYILHKMSRRILEPWAEPCDGKYFELLDKAIFEAQNAAMENYNNQLGKKDVFDGEYISMRKEQRDVLLEIYKSLIDIKTVPSTAALVSDFFEKVSVEYETKNDVRTLLKELQEIRASMKEKPLPENRAEFEDRAMLFVILKRMEEFLAIKRDFHSRFAEKLAKL